MTEREALLDARIRAAESVDAHNDPPEVRLDAVRQLFAIGLDAMTDEHVAIASSCAYLVQKRLGAHVFMQRLEREAAADG